MSSTKPKCLATTTSGNNSDIGHCTWGDFDETQSAEVGTVLLVAPHSTVLTRCGACNPNHNYNNNNNNNNNSNNTRQQTAAALTPAGLASRGPVHLAQVVPPGLHTLLPVPAGLVLLSHPALLVHLGQAHALPHHLVTQRTGSVAIGQLRGGG